MQFIGNCKGDREHIADVIVSQELLLMEHLHFHLTVHNPFRPLEGLIIDLKVGTLTKNSLCLKYTFSINFHFCLDSSTCCRRCWTIATGSGSVPRTIVAFWRQSYFFAVPSQCFVKKAFQDIRFSVKSNVYIFPFLLFLVYRLLLPPFCPVRAKWILTSTGTCSVQFEATAFTVLLKSSPLFLFQLRQ